jgi:glycosyltransferase involved in cell wall biosynthesis
MHVMLDARYLDARPGNTYGSGGIAKYVLTLVEGMLRTDPDLRLRLLVPPGRAHRVADDPRVEDVVVDMTPQSLQTLFWLPRRVPWDGVDLFHAPANVLPRGLPCPAVTTVHDVMWIVDPSLCASFLPKRLASGFYYRLGIGEALRASARILTISEASRDAIAGIAPDRRDAIRVVRHGADPFFRPVPIEEATRRTAGSVPPGTRFALVIGQSSPYKNHRRAVEAFLDAFGPDEAFKLVLVRRFTRVDFEMTALLGRPEVRRRVILVPQVDREFLRDLYVRASIFLFPSLCEGFGLPLLEAMGCGCPVVTSGIGATAEVTGDAAVHVDPTRTASIAQGLRRLADDADLRERLRARGLERAAAFSWDEAVRRTLEVYREAIAAGAPGRR